nr:hypothetical protein [Sicyoidochytrium minutum DNA virus]
MSPRKQNEGELRGSANASNRPGTPAT